MFNPLDTVREDPMDGFDDARKLVDLLMVPGEKKEDYWDKRGLKLLADAIMDVALNETGEERTLQSVFDRINYDATLPLAPVEEDVPAGNYVTPNSELWFWAQHLMESPVQRLRRAGKQLLQMPTKPRDSVFETARTHVEDWEAPRIEALTSRSTFDPLSLRRDKATLYICVSLEEMKLYTSFLRTLIGQTFYALCRGTVPHDATTVTFIVDEMPALERMDILLQALDTGRKYGIRLWMFAQKERQLEKIYGSADDFLKGCYGRQWMGLDPEDAAKHARLIGERFGLLDGRRKLLVEGHQLYAEEFQDLMLTSFQSHSLAALEKTPAYSDEECVRRAPQLRRRSS